jgi:tetratricopeptide (TPR) repeat protein
MMKTKVLRSVLLWGTLLGLLETSQPVWAQAPKKEKKEKVSPKDARQEQADEELNQQLLQELAERDKVNTEYLFTEGMQHFLLADYPKAIKSFESAMKLAPTNAAIAYQLSQCYFKLAKYPEALKLAQASLANDRTNKYYHLLVAECYERMERYADAEKTYRNLLGSLPSVDEHYYDLAEALFAQSKYEEAIKTFDELEKKIGQEEDLILRKQRLYLILRDIDGAIKEGSKLINANPTDPEYQLTQVELLLRHDRRPEAKQLLAQIVTNFPKEARARLLLSEIAGAEGNQAGQLSELEAAFANPSLGLDERLQMLADFFDDMKTPEQKATGLKLAEATVAKFPTEGRAQRIYGAYLSENNRPREAREAYRKSLKDDGNNYQVWAGVIKIDLELQDHAALASDTEAALEYFPTQSVFWLYNGTAHFLKRNFDQARESLEQAKLYADADNQEVSFQILAQMGEVYNALKQYDASDKAYEAALALRPNDLGVLNNYSYYLSLRRQHLDKARTMSAKLVQAEPNNASFLDTHGWVLYVAGDYKAALPFLEKAVKANPNNGVILEHYGDALFRAGQVNEALVQWQKAKQVGGDLTPQIDRKIADKKLHE